MAELILGDVLARLVGQPLVLDFGIGIDMRAIKTRKHCGG